MQLYKQEEYYKIIGLCMEVHRVLGGGLLEAVYKEALEIEFKSHDIPYEREKEFIIDYKEHQLSKRFYADFVVYDTIILEVKAIKIIVDDNIAQTLNYMSITKSGLGIIANFSLKSLQQKRLVL
ncbi:GxxExxY protein [Flavobacterium sp. I-SCBP12n]|uniref:GxxExxY protein n=2 Tax=Flavobacterium TaxID=237 RepID=A0A9X2BNJ0_9FLAO|nr:MULTISPECIES: GxxExxY protein [Flavobacterium]MBP4140609.1 GxxExxY protein [Flavobacterium flabelliforme]MCK8142015.1 GxxExxY protein [Flavobacterium pygoscelis]